MTMTIGLLTTITIKQQQQQQQQQQQSTAVDITTTSTTTIILMVLKLHQLRVSNLFYKIKDIILRIQLSDSEKMFCGFLRSNT